MTKEAFFRTCPSIPPKPMALVKPEKDKLVKVTTLQGNEYLCYRINNWEYFVKDNPLLTIEHDSIVAWEYVND